MKYFLFFWMFFLSFQCPVWAQVEMADSMRAEGKIYVVVAIIVLILLGLVAYLFTLDKKIKKLENLLNEKQRQTK